jgi:signal transduction histidine kinase
MLNHESSLKIMNSTLNVQRTVLPEELYAISRIVIQSSEWKPALDQIAKLVRSFFIFDNLAVYLEEPKQHNLDVFFARAVGRGRSAEADISWGEIIANRVMETRLIINEEPPEDKTKNRLERPYLLGIPLRDNQHYMGALVFIRFGGPPFQEENIQLAEYIASQIALLIEREYLQQEYNLLEEQHQQAQLQQDFISTITHEIRNPLGFIKGYATTLLRSDTTWDHDTQLEFLQIIDQETDRLQELIDNLLDSARLQSGQLDMKFQLLRLDTLMNDVIQRAEIHYPGMKIRWEEKNSIVPIQGNPRRLAQVFENLIGNAVKYAPGSEVLITIGHDEIGDDIEVRDFGPGIAPEYLPFIFNRFFRTPDHAPNVRGSGLGLYICRQIIQAHGGKISVTSISGEGTAFHIFLPNDRHRATQQQNKERDTQ